MKRAATIFISVIMTLSLGVNAFAAVITHDIENDGDLLIGEDGNSNSYVVTGTGAPTSHRIIVSGVTSTTITLHNVNIVTEDASAIDIGDDADVALVVDGANSLTVTTHDTDDVDDEAGIHISGGSLTISGTDADDDILTVQNINLDGAVIGSNNGEDFTGTITIDGGVTVNAGFNDIGDEYYDYGAAIGSGGYGEMNGTIVINEGSVVNAYSVDYGAGIGSGYMGNMNGSIIINGGEISTASGYYGASIGAGSISDMNGTIEINGGNINVDSPYGDYGIGSGEDGYTNGDIIIHGNAAVTLGEEEFIGSEEESSGTIYLYKGAEINGITVENIEDLKEAGILNDNMIVELLEESKTDSGHSYSLNKSNSVSKIKAAKAGDTVYVYESQLSKGKVPYYVLEELAKTDGVTLVVVSDSGETVEIKSSNIPEKGKNAFFTVDELMEMEN